MLTLESLAKRIERLEYHAGFPPPVVVAPEPVEEPVETPQPVINVIPNTTPPVPPEYGVGATVRRRGVGSDDPMRVLFVGNGNIRVEPNAAILAENPDFLGFFDWRQVELVTPAPDAGEGPE